MRPRRPNPEELDLIVSLLAFQFSWRVADAFYALRDSVTITVARGRIRYVYINGKHALTLRPTTGLFTISKVMGRVIVRAEPSPRFRVIVRGDRDIRGSVLARDLVEMDDNIRPGDEVVVVTPGDEVLATGRARVSAGLARSLEYGEVVRVRR